jgi:hypothetical protein
VTQLVCTGQLKSCLLRDCARVSTAPLASTQQVVLLQSVEVLTTGRPLASRRPLGPAAGFPRAMGH